jgi:hypothetical protein
MSEASIASRTVPRREVLRAIFLDAAALTTLCTPFAHSYFGEKRLIGPLVASNDGVMSRRLAKQLIRFAWHLTSLLWIGQAMLLVRAAVNPQHFDCIVVGGIGVLHVGVGLFDGGITRGQHMGWPLLTAIGIFALLALA